MIPIARSGVPIVRRSVQAPLYPVALCGSCGTAAGAPMARICTRTDCGLSCRHHADLGTSGKVMTR